MTLIDELKSQYRDLKRGICPVRERWSRGFLISRSLAKAGPVELYACYKYCHPRSRISKDNFFLLYIYFTLAKREKDGSINLNLRVRKERSRITSELFYLVTGKKIMERPWPDQDYVYQVRLRYPHLIEDSFKCFQRWHEDHSQIFGNELAQMLKKKREKSVKLDMKLIKKLISVIAENKEITIRGLNQKIQKHNNKKLHKKDFLYYLWDLEKLAPELKRLSIFKEASGEVSVKKGRPVGGKSRASIPNSSKGSLSN